jgi:hypothetical protein
MFHLLVMLILLLAIPGTARELSPSDMETVLDARRTALGYLRTQNVDLAALEIERLEKALDSTPHDGLAATARAALETGDLEGATRALNTLGDALASERQARGTLLLADCVQAFTQTYAALDVYRTSLPDLADGAIAQSVATAAERSRAMLLLCDGEAPPNLKSDPGFRRLVEGAAASLALVQQATARRDQGLLFRLLIELRSFEQLLLFRYG